MQELYICIVVVATIVLGIVTLSIAWVARLVRENIHRRTLELLSDYDHLLERKSRELTRINRTIVEKQEELETLIHPRVEVETKVEERPAAPPAFLQISVERVSRTTYRDRRLGQLYRQVKGGFSQSPQEILNSFPDGGAGGEGGPATSLLRQLHYELCCQLLTIDGRDQYTILQETLSPEELTLLEAYGKAEAKFSILGFYTYLQGRAESEPGETIIYLPMGESLRCPPRSRVIEDPEICEGVVIVYRGQAYDYAIKGREIG